MEIESQLLYYNYMGPRSGSGLATECLGFDHQSEISSGSYFAVWKLRCSQHSKTHCIVSNCGTWLESNGYNYVLG
jgi:hypothetical protein